MAFVLGGGGVLGAVEVGMLRALLEYGIRPDLVVGTSIGPVNGVLAAADPSPALDAAPDRVALPLVGPLRRVDRGNRRASRDYDDRPALGSH